MADHINISDPDRDEDRWRHIRELDQLRAELKTAYAERDHYRNNLESIFTRIARGDAVQLHYRDRKVIDVIARPTEAPTP